LVRAPLTKNLKLFSKALPLGRTARASNLRGFPWGRVAFGALLLLVSAIVAGGVGSVAIPPLDTVRIIASRLPFVEISQTWADTSGTILWNLRLPRVVLAGLTGAALAVSGATYQGLFRNPLADPYLIGVASGAGLAATIVLLAGVPVLILGFSVLPVAAFLGAVTAVTLAYLISRNADGMHLTTLILAGVAITSLTTGITTLIMLRSAPDLRPVFSWLLGGFNSAQWTHSAMLLPYLLLGTGAIMAYARIMNLMQLSEEHAKQMGVNVQRAKLVLLAAATLATSAAVSFSGLIGFVGLIAPHAVRLVWGTDYRYLVPMSALIGASFMIVADLAARTVASPAELPVGVVTAFCGAPFFLYLLKARKAN